MEIDPERIDELQAAFNGAFENLSDSFFNGDIVRIISCAFEFAASNPLCIALMSAVFALLGFHIFALAVKSFKRG